MKKLICLLSALAMTGTMLSGCGTQTADSGKEKVTIALWGTQLLENYTQYLCDTFPEVEFDFTLATNSTDFYRYLNDHDDLPDILTVRRFSLKDAVLIKDLLYDFCDTELASAFYGSYLENYTYDDGTINWLPACADIDSIIINETLFKEHNIAVPTDYNSFIAACEAFEKQGIKGFCSDFGSDYTCMEVLQGFSISQLLSMEGREWRQKYESGLTNQLSEQVWMPVFEKFFDMKEKTGLGEAETQMINQDPKRLYMEGKLAMYRGTGTDVIGFPGREGDRSILLPYFGDTENDNWYLTYPSFHVAAGKKAMEDPKREELLLKIMTAMLSQEGQRCITYGKNMIPYNKDVNLELLPELDNIKPYIEQNKMYIRLASGEMFSISENVVQRILKGELDTPKKAFDAFNALMAQNETSGETAAHIDTPYSNEFTKERGNPAASAVYNTVLAEADVDMVFGQSCYISSDVYKGDYTEKDLGYMINNDVGKPVIAKLTGKQLFDLVSNTLSLKGNRGAVCNDSTLYVSSGFEMDISKKDGNYVLNAITVGGKELDPNAEYSVLICSDYDWYVVEAMSAVGCEDYRIDDVHFESYVFKRLIDEKGQLEAPTDYIKLR
ncbi:MAG: 5'-nucleotidase C-terminal domain-containing protein [Clostridiales bacterium]|nr:5'-nucleotidase C-terminal domain-containing protein [Clostridiales bacterium]